jgi:hypothetical protein
VADTDIQAADGMQLVSVDMPERYVSSCVCGMAIVGLVIKRYGPKPAEPEIAAALDAMHDQLEHMREGGI